MKMEAVYVTRDTYETYVDIWPATVGIRKFYGCAVYGAAWSKNKYTIHLYPRSAKKVEFLSKSECQQRFGFYPRAGTAWYINTRGKRSKVDIDFSP